MNHMKSISSVHHFFPNSFQDINMHTYYCDTSTMKITWLNGWLENQCMLYDDHFDYTIADYNVTDMHQAIEASDSKDGDV